MRVCGRIDRGLQQRWATARARATIIWCCIATAVEEQKQTKVVQTREVVPAQRVVQREVVYVQEPQVIYQPAPPVVYQPAPTYRVVTSKPDYTVVTTRPTYRYVPVTRYYYD